MRSFLQYIYVDIGQSVVHRGSFSCGGRSFFRDCSVSEEAEFRLFRRDAVGSALRNFLVAGLRRLFGGIRSAHVRL